MYVTVFNTKFNEYRNERGKIYPLKGLIEIIMHGLSFNLVGCASIHRYCEKIYTSKKLEKLGLKKFPSIATIRRAVTGLGIEFNKEPQGVEGKVLHLDGKSICGSQDEAGGVCHLTNLYSGEDRILIASKITQAGSGVGGERSAAKEILEETNVTGAIITADAGFSSGDFPEHIIKARADFFLKVKDNTKTLKRTMQTRLSQQSERRGDKFSQTDLMSGKLYEREITVLPAVALFSVLPEGLRHAQRFGVVKNTVTYKKTQQVSVTEHFFITSLSEEKADAQRLLQIQLQHWRVENELHRPKDMFLGEDNKTIRTAKKAQNISTLLSIIITILYQIDKSVVKAIDKIRATPSLFNHTFRKITHSHKNKILYNNLRRT